MKKKTIVTNDISSSKRDATRKGISLSISILSPIILLVVFEVMLRVFGYGVNMDLFSDYKLDNRFLIMNPDVSKKYFTNAEDATTGLAEIFRKEKTPDTFRAFVLGASTGMGFPYTSNGSFSRWLKYRLMNEYPDKEIEIINLSLTAVNSYAALDFSKQLIDYAPDVVLVYLGHNEYYGALGVGSTSKLGNNIRLVRLLTNLRELRIVQLINNINQKANTNDDDSVVSENLMIEMAENTDIAWGSDEYHMGIEQFRSNMDEICQILSNENIPTIISTLVSNEKSLKPFISDSSSNELSAEYYYHLATENYSNGDFNLAKDQFVKAKELDLLRYRAPEEMNDIIQKLSDHYPGIFVADSREMFEVRSEYGILGDDMLMDHVHPYLFGQGLISESFYQVLKDEEIIPGSFGDRMTFPELLEEMPLTTVDSLKGIYLMDLLLKEWPFNRTDISEPNLSSLEANLANRVVYDAGYWYDAMGELSSYYQSRGDWSNALKVAEASMLAFPYEESSYAESYQMSLKNNNLEKAEFHLHKAFLLNPAVDKARDLFSLNMDIDKIESATYYLDFLLLNDKGNSEAYSLMKEKLNQINTLKLTLAENPDDVDLINQIASLFFQLNYKDVTIKYLEMSLRKDPNNSPAQELLEQAEALPNFYN